MVPRPRVLRPQAEADAPTATLRQFVADCAELPPSLWPAQPVVPAPRAAGDWSVDEQCLAQVADLEDYGS